MNPWHYIKTVALATDIEINAVTGGEQPASPQGTISLRAAVAAQNGHGYKRLLGRAMCAFLAFVSRSDHCGDCLREAQQEGQEL